MNVCAERKITKRAQLYAELQVYRGTEQAKKLSGYKYVQRWRLENNPNFRRYRMKVLQGYLKSINKTQQDLVEEYHALAKDSKASSQVKEKVLKQMIEWSEDLEDAPEDVYRAERDAPDVVAKAMRIAEGNE